MRQSGTEISTILNEPEIDAQDFATMIAKLSINFHRDISKFENGKPSVDFLLVKDIFERCKSLRWSKREFHTRLNWFLDNHPWDNFKRAHFLGGYEKPKLYPESWKTAEYQRDPNSVRDMEGYEVITDEGETIVMYRYRDGTRIPGLKKVFPEYKKYYVKSSMDEDYHEWYCNELEKAINANNNKTL